MRLFTLFFLLCICLQVVSAQAIKKNYIGFCIGPAFPLGAYASKDSLNTGAGLAKTGYVMEVSLGLRHGKYWGMCVSIKGIYNNIDQDALIANYRQNGLSYTNNWNPRTKDPWSIGSFLIGGFGSIPVNTSNSFFIEPKFMLGISRCSTPAIQLDHKGRTSTTLIDIANSFCYSIGVLVRYDLRPKLNLLVGADYFTTEPTFEDLAIGGGVRQDGSQKISTLNISAGIGIRITGEK